MKMLLKHHDGRHAEIRELDRLLLLPLTAGQRVMVRRELAAQVGLDEKERDVAAFLDFRYQETRNWALIHDLRIERLDEEAQIDHLLINRFLDVYVIFSRNYHQGMKVTEDGEFQLWDGREYLPVESPLERNLRQIQVLRQSVGERDLGPRRLGYPVPVKYRNVVVFSPVCNLVKAAASTVDPASVLRVDEFVVLAEATRAHRADLDASKMVSYDILREFGEKLVRLHRRRPAVDYAEWFKVHGAPEPEP